MGLLVLAPIPSPILVGGPPWTLRGVGRGWHGALGGPVARVLLGGLPAVGRMGRLSGGGSHGPVHVCCELQPCSVQCQDRFFRSCRVHVYMQAFVLPCSRGLGWGGQKLPLLLPSVTCHKHADMGVAPI